MDLNFDDKLTLDPKNDVVFQRIFGSPENKDILISFLNALLERTEKEKVVNIEYVDTKLSNIETIDDKIGVLDVRVITEKGIHINVEVQLINRYNMINRTLFYWSRLYSNQIKSGENYKNLNKTITINILNFNYIDSEKYHTTFHLYEDDEKTMLTDLLEIHFVNLVKYLEEGVDLNNSLSKWLAFLTKPSEGGIEVGEPAIRKAITVLDTLSRDPETVRLAELRMKKILDERSMLEGAREEAKAEGRAEGKAEGKAEGRTEGITEGKVEGKEEDAISFLRLGISAEVVAQGTGLSIDRVLELKEIISSTENK